ncbi:hypothetical protein EJ06DRAFT_523356 [Trichodelitschia bisporula]|uniref:Glycoside hydrolase n=1 Tax=Trichodelitschia bisporula TaxID=703511 RepID=A0A6G1HQ31_9PEZI|nr:hypothetical protein EJ06DRAFT_523356 [Trichodelitschia bisporula]
MWGSGIGAAGVFGWGLLGAGRRVGNGGVGRVQNAPLGVETWCGKAYKASNASFDPGGQLEPPPLSDVPLLDLQVAPRMSIYLSTESQASLIVSAAITHTVGEPYCAEWDPSSELTRMNGTSFRLTITLLDRTTVLSTTSIAANTTLNEIPIPLTGLKAGTTPQQILLTLTSPHCPETTFFSITTLTLLPPPENGSAARTDALHGGLHVLTDSSAPTTWEPIFPYSFYGDWGGHFAGSPSNLSAFASHGFNIFHPTPGADPSAPWGEWASFDAALDQLEELGLWLMYDMRWSYKNLTAVTAQVERIKHRKRLLLWYTADEPDGWGDALDAPLRAADAIRTADPYHPVSLVLNCANFHFGPYAAGADILLTDPYPVGNNASYSTLWDTPCNATYGDCGCDGCIGELKDVARRMDMFREYEGWMRAVEKPLWAVPQVFGGRGECDGDGVFGAWG